MINIGIICPSEIAARRFLPALKKANNFKFSGIAIATKEEWFGKDANATDEEWEKLRSLEHVKAEAMTKDTSAKIFHSYDSIIKDPSIDAIYIPLPPALHYRWAKLALENNKHVFLEKPSTITLNDTVHLVELAKKYKLALHENYMFAYHNQIEYVRNLIAGNKLGDIRLIRIAFGFPLRQLNDFRYKKTLGGGALLDCAGYTLKLASILLGEDIKFLYSNLNNLSGFGVDMYGSAALTNNKGQVAQVAFGMDNSYKCELEIWGSKGTFFTNRILTAPVDYEPDATIKVGNEIENFKLPSDDTFLKSINIFENCIKDCNTREMEYDSIINQSSLIDDFIKALPK